MKKIPSGKEKEDVFSAERRKALKRIALGGLSLGVGVIVGGEAQAGYGVCYYDGRYKRCDYTNGGYGVSYSDGHGVSYDYTDD